MESAAAPATLPEPHPSRNLDRYITADVYGGKTEILDVPIDGGENEPLIVALFHNRDDAIRFCRAANVAAALLATLQNLVYAEDTKRISLGNLSAGVRHWIAKGTGAGELGIQPPVAALDLVRMALNTFEPQLERSPAFRDCLDAFGHRANFEHFMAGARKLLGLKRCTCGHSSGHDDEHAPNPAKLTDSRCRGYMEEHGDESWELDALEPSVLADLIRTNIEAVRNDRKFEARLARRDEGRQLLGMVSNKWTDVAEFVRN